MSEIEKMYRAAKVVPSHHYCNECQYDMSAECPIRCPDNVAVYPPFTAEKQIELIKWLAKRDYGDYTSSLLINITDNLVYFSAGAKSNYCAIEVLYDSNKCTDFENALAGLINDIWQDLTEEEKQQVKGILE